MSRAVEIARQARPHPNPRVGCVLLDATGNVIAEGFHEKAGEAHAEQLALDLAVVPVHTAVVTLEPCSHTGQTPPCTEGLIRAGVARVVVGSIDPDPRVSGRGIRRLTEAGLDVELTGPDIAEVDPGYAWHRRTGRPRVTLKMAATLDGQTATDTGESQWITGERARADAQVLRSEADAIVVGIGTAIADTPRLTVRIDGYQGPQPRPVVITGDRSLPDEHRLQDPLVYGPHGVAGVVGFPGPAGVDLNAVIADLGERGYLDIMVEGGATLAASFWAEDLVDEIVLYLAAKIAGGYGQGLFADVFTDLADARSVAIRSIDRVGEDIVLRASVARDGT